MSAEPISSSSALAYARHIQSIVPQVRTVRPSLEMIRKVRGPIVIYRGFIVPMGKRRDAQIQQQFGQRVRELRKQKDLSQEALALGCDLDRTYIGGVERGERNISLLNIHKIAEALGVPAKDLLDA
jgi:DNA-binding XRE family transcriptional regulator